jgi:hypothetical protein
MSKPIRILGIAGSLRRESYNRAALRAATALVPKGAHLETFELDGIPVFNPSMWPQLSSPFECFFVFSSLYPSFSADYGTQSRTYW